MPKEIDGELLYTVEEYAALRMTKTAELFGRSPEEWLDIKAERDRYHQALEKIACQGLGHYNHDRRCIIDANDEPWIHWASRAALALQHIDAVAVASSRKE